MKDRRTKLEKLEALAKDKGATPAERAAAKRKADKLRKEGPEFEAFRNKPEPEPELDRDWYDEFGRFNMDYWPFQKKPTPEGFVTIPTEQERVADDPIVRAMRQRAQRDSMWIITALRKRGMI